MRANLKVPFAEKDEAKKLGARWDAARKIWYVESKLDMAPFSKWSPTPHESLGADARPQKSASVAKQQTAGKVIVGSEYIAQPRICKCLPWEVCDKCQSAALTI